MAKCHFGTKEVDPFRRTITTKGVPSQKNRQFFRKKNARANEVLQRNSGVLNWHKNYITRLTENFNPFPHLWRMVDNNDKIIFTQEPTN